MLQSCSIPKYPKEPQNGWVNILFIFFWSRNILRYVDRMFTVTGLSLTTITTKWQSLCCPNWPLLEVGPKLDFESRVSLGRNVPNSMMPDSLQRTCRNTGINLLEFLTWEIHRHSCSPQTHWIHSSELHDLVSFTGLVHPVFRTNALARTSSNLHPLQRKLTLPLHRWGTWR